MVAPESNQTCPGCSQKLHFLIVLTFQWGGSAWYLYSYPLREMFTSPWIDFRGAKKLKCSTVQIKPPMSLTLFLPVCIIFLICRILEKGLGPNQRKRSSIIQLLYRESSNTWSLPNNFPASTPVLWASVWSVSYSLSLSPAVHVCLSDSLQRSPETS